MENPCRIVFFGDSITRECAAPFADLLANRFPDVKIEAVNAGMIGETSRDGLKRLGTLVQERPQVAVIGFGMNDWRKGVGKGEFRENLSAMVREFLNAGARVVLLTVNPARSGRSRRVRKEPAEYSEVVRGVAQEHRVKVADVNALWKGMLRNPLRGLRDEIHPNRRGYAVYFEALRHVVPHSHTVVLWQYNGRECKCNYKCPYCYYAYSPKSENYFWGKIEDWRRAFKDAFGNQRLVFYLAFGEPTLGEAFYAVVGMIESEPNWSLRITSNISGDLARLVDTRLAKGGRLNINASFHPTQTTTEEFVERLLFLREHGIESPVVYVTWPGQLDRFESDLATFHELGFVVHARPFKGRYREKVYPEGYTDDERRFIAKYCDDATIRYMLNKKPVLDRRTYSGFHFFIVDCAGNIGMDSDCFRVGTKYRTLYGNISASHSLRFPTLPPQYPIGCTQATVDGVSNYIETGYRQLESNNVLHYAAQGGVFKREHGEVVYSNWKQDFTDSRVRADYCFPPRGLKDRFYLLKHLGLRGCVKCNKYLLHRALTFAVKRLNYLLRL